MITTGDLEKKELDMRVRDGFRSAKSSYPSLLRAGILRQSVRVMLYGRSAALPLIFVFLREFASSNQRTGYEAEEDIAVNGPYGFPPVHTSLLEIEECTYFKATFRFPLDPSPLYGQASHASLRDEADIYDYSLSVFSVILQLLLLPYLFSCRNADLPSMNKGV